MKRVITPSIAISGMCAAPMIADAPKNALLSSKSTNAKRTPETKTGSAPQRNQSIYLNFAQRKEAMYNPLAIKDGVAIISVFTPNVVIPPYPKSNPCKKRAIKIAANARIPSTAPIIPLMSKWAEVGPMGI